MVARLDDFLITKPERSARAPRVMLLLAHGAGAPMDSPFMEDCATRLATLGITVVRFEFEYMAVRRHSGVKRPPPKMDVLQGEYRNALARCRINWPKARLFIGGKSMGGRVASMIADERWAAGDVSGCVCLGYPFHPPRKLEKLRTAHLEAMTCPTLIVQGTRDALGGVGLIATLALSPKIDLAWIGDGDHDFKSPAKSTFTHRGNMAAAMDAVAAFVCRRHAPPEI